MQVMPRTGRSVAKHIGIKNFKKSRLREAETNVPIGSAYMKMMLDKFDGNITLATAAYNAGPHRVLKWLPKKVCAENPDIWVELIPFNETRKYVRRVLYFSIVYDWRFKMTIKPMKDRMALITPKSKKLITKLSCNSIELLDKKNVEEEKIVKTAIHNETTTEYTVKKGDSLWLIARKFDIWVTDLLKWNNLKRNRPLQPGQILKINTEKNVN
jgi:nucleoid-associated protein YgaU